MQKENYDSIGKFDYLTEFPKDKLEVVTVKPILALIVESFQQPNALELYLQSISTKKGLKGKKGTGAKGK